jgi:hypothetical protein
MAVIQEYLEMSPSADFKIFKNNEVVMKIVRMLKTITETAAATDVMLFYAWFLTSIYKGCDYMSCFMKPLSENFLAETQRILERSVSVFDVSEYEKIMYENCCRNYTTYLNEWYSFQKVYNTMLANLCMFSAKSCKDYMQVARKVSEVKKGNTIFHKHVLEIQDLIRDMVGEISMLEEQIECKNNVDNVFKTYVGSGDSILMATQELQYVSSVSKVDFSANVNYIRGLLLQIHDIRDGKTHNKEEILLVQQVLSRI